MVGINPIESIQDNMVFENLFLITPNKAMKGLVKVGSINSKTIKDILKQQAVW